MDKSWIKLFRRINTHSLSTDIPALGVFTWLLINVNTRTGKILVGRFATSKQLGMKPSTFRDVVARLEKVHKVLTTAPTTGRHTEISLINWAKYQAPQPTDDSSDDKRTTQLKNINNITNTKHVTNTDNGNVKKVKKTYNPYQRKIIQSMIDAGFPSPEGYERMEDYILSLPDHQKFEFAIKFGGVA